LVRLRKEEPLLRLREFAEAQTEDRPEIYWFNEHGAEMTWTEWKDPQRRLVAQTICEKARSHGLVILTNAGDTDVDFTLPSTIQPDTVTVTRVFSSAIEHDERDPVGMSPAGSLQVLRVESTAAEL
jgi:pullulanase/glycogen debranching enzyme